MKISKFTYSIPLLFLLISSVEATTLKEVVDHTMKKNQDIASKSLNNNAFRKYIDEQRGGYYPRLDLTAYLESKKTKENFDDNAQVDTDTKQNGGNIQLDFEQLLYDGNLTPSKVEKAKNRYISNKYKNSNEIESILQDSINDYLNMVKFKERIKTSEENLKVHESYLSIAQETESINGEILDKVQTKAKIHNAKSRLFDEINSQNSAKSSFKKNVDMKIDGNICRPNIDESKIPSTLTSLQKLALQNNYEILEQISKIKEQKASISQEKSNFLPTLKFKLQGIYDKDLLKDDTTTKEYNAKLELKYNIFNGFIDESKTQREELFLKEAQSKLDVVSKSVLDNITVAYNTYVTSKKQIVELQQFIEENKQIIDIYNDQFDSGTRNFIDVLNVEADLYNSKVNLINTEYTMYQSYYDILKNTSTLQTTFLNSDNQICSNINTDNKLSAVEDTKEDENINSVLNEDVLEETNVTMPEVTIQNEYALFLDSYNDRYSADKTLEKISSTLENEMKSKIVSNSNGTYTVAIYNINGKNEAVSVKNKFDSKFPHSYYIKKKK